MPKSPAGSGSPSDPSTTLWPTAARQRHDLIERADRPIEDAAGRIARPFLVVSILERLERDGAIGAAERKAGEAFHCAFRLAMLDVLKAAPLDRVMGLPLAAVFASGHEGARKHVMLAIRRLGGEGARGASCVWHVLGLEWSLRQWAAKATRGNGHEARGILIASLPILPPDFSA